MEHNNSTVNDQTTEPTTEQSRTSTVKFHGQTGEYFSIWMVNVLFTFVTLGIYSAWAKVRNERYFKSNTEIDNHRLSYLAEPLQILKGRIIALVIVAAFYFLVSLSPIVGGLLLIGYLFAIPWLICRSIKFNMQMIGYRNIRFNFHGQYGEAFLVFCIYPILSVFTLYIALPFALKEIDNFIYNNISYGDKPLKSELKASTYFKASFGALLIGIVMFTIAVFAIGVDLSVLSKQPQDASVEFMFAYALLMATYFAVFIIAGAFYRKIIRNHIFDNSEFIDIASFKSSVSMRTLTWLAISNIIALILTLGLALPWVKIRNARYYSQVTQVTVHAGADKVIADKAETVSAVGDEVSDALDFDISIG